MRDYARQSTSWPSELRTDRRLFAWTMRICRRKVRGEQTRARFAGVKSQMARFSPGARRSLSRAPASSRIFPPSLPLRLATWRGKTVKCLFKAIESQGASVIVSLIRGSEKFRGGWGGGWGGIARGKFERASRSEEADRGTPGAPKRSPFMAMAEEHGSVIHLPRGCSGHASAREMRRFSLVKLPAAARRAFRRRSRARCGAGI